MQSNESDPTTSDDLSSAKAAESKSSNFDLMRNYAESILSLSPESIIVTSLDGIIQSANLTANQLLGYKDEELKGKHFSEITALHIFDDDNFTKLVGKGSISRNYVNYITVNDEKIPMLLTGALLKNSNDEPIGNIAFAKDMREVQDIIAALHLTRSFNENALSLIHTGFVALDRNKRILFCNPGFCRLVNQKDLVGEKLSDILSSDELDDAVNNAFTSDNEIHNLEITHPTIGNKSSELMIEASLIHFDGGKHLSRRPPTSIGKWQAKTHSLLVVDDVTEHKRTQELENEKKSLHSSLAAFEKLLGIVGHELRTPLAALRVTTELLITLGTDLPKQVVQFMQSIHDQVIQMSNMVNDLLEVARLNSGTANWTWSVVSIKHACEQALNTVGQLVDCDKVALALNIEDPKLTISGDANAISRLVINLLSNAHKNTQEGSISVNVKFLHEDDLPWAIIEVSDTGSGISPAIVNKLGEAFALNSGVVGDNYIQGSGLGLTICKGIAATHGGAIFVSSAVGKGTTIKVKLRADLRDPIMNYDDIKNIVTETR